MIIDKNFTYIIQNESTYFTFNLHNYVYNVNQLLSQLDCNILYDKENSIHKSTIGIGKWKITKEPLMLNFLFPDKKQFLPNLDKELTEQILKQFK